MTQSRPQTILFADVSGSTRLFETKGDHEARRLIANVLGALTKVCEQHGGRVIKTIGDEIMCTFPAALNGVLAACDMQRRMGRDIDFVRDSLAVRIGEDEEIKVHRDELHLRKSGTISLGQSFAVNSGDIIYFEAD